MLRLTMVGRKQYELTSTRPGECYVASIYARKNGGWSVADDAGRKFLGHDVPDKFKSLREAAEAVADYTDEALDASPHYAERKRLRSV